MTRYPIDVAPSSAEIHRKIAQLLHHAGAQNMYTIAEDIGQAPFRVRAELRVMRRHRLVAEMITRESHLWELTPAGHHVAAAADQMEML